MYPIYKDIYLKPLLEINHLNLKKDLENLNPKEILEYLINNNLTENDIKIKYLDFVQNKKIENMCLSEKLIYLQYTLELQDVTKDMLKPVIDTL